MIDILNVAIGLGIVFGVGTYMTKKNKINKGNNTIKNLNISNKNRLSGNLNKLSGNQNKLNQNKLNRNRLNLNKLSKKQDRLSRNLNSNQCHLNQGHLGNSNQCHLSKSNQGYSTQKITTLNLYNKDENYSVKALHKLRQFAKKIYKKATTKVEQKNAINLGNKSQNSVEAIKTIKNSENILRLIEEIKQKFDPKKMRELLQELEQIPQGYIENLIIYIKKLKENKSKQNSNVQNETLESIKSVLESNRNKAHKKLIQISNSLGEMKRSGKSSMVEGTKYLGLIISQFLVKLSRKRQNLKPVNGNVSKHNRNTKRKKEKLSRALILLTNKTRKKTNKNQSKNISTSNRNTECKKRKLSEALLLVTNKMRKNANENQLLYDEITQLNLQINYKKNSIENITQRIYTTKQQIENEINEKKKKKLEERLKNDNKTKITLEKELIEITMKIKEL